MSKGKDIRDYFSVPSSSKEPRFSDDVSISISAFTIQHFKGIFKFQQSIDIKNLIIVRKKRRKC